MGLDDSRLSGRSLPSDPYLSSASYSLWIAAQEAKRAAEARSSGSRAARRGAIVSPSVSGFAPHRLTTPAQSQNTEELVELLHTIGEVDIRCASAPLSNPKCSEFGIRPFPFTIASECTHQD